MKQLIIFVIIVISILLGITDSYSQENKFKPEYSIVLSPNEGGKMLKQCSRSIPENIDSFFELTTDEIQKLENNFKDVLNLKSTNCCFIGGKLRTLDNFVFQYIGIEIKGKRYIYINAFEYESSEDLNKWYKTWKTDPIVVCDGGESFWGVLFDFESKKFSQLAFNGVA